MSTAVVAAAMVAGATHAETLPSFTSMDVFELEWASAPEISSDGERILYRRNSMDVMTDRHAGRLWLVDSDGSNHVPLTGRDVSESRGTWSPDGSRIAFTSSTENGSEIHVYWVDEGKSARLTQLDRSPGNLSWSPDGSMIAFSMLVPEAPPMLVSAPKKPDGADWADEPRVTTRLKYERDGSGYIEPGFHHFFVVPADGGSARQITSGDFHHRGAASWSADSRTLFFSANRNDNWEHAFANSEIYAVSLDDGQTIALTERNGPDFSPRVSPDGETVAYLGYEDKVRAYQLTRLQLMNADGSGQRELLPDLDRSISNITWSADSKRIYFTYDNHGDTRIAVTTLDGKWSDVATNLGGTTIGRPYGGGSFSVSRSGQIAYTHVTSQRPADIAVVGRRSAPTVITQLNDDILKFRQLATVEEVWYESSFDGRKIQGWIAKPPGYDSTKTYPLLVENHGGPISNYGARFSPEIQLYAAAGYLVFYPNPRGSTSYGEEFGDLLFNNYPGEDYQDVMDGVDYLIEKGLATEEQLYVTGGSAGGIMTAWMIGKSNRFRSAAVIKPILNWMSKTLTADNYYAYADYRYPGQPWENMDGYLKFSPISLVGNIQTPTLVMVGTDDRRTPISEAKQLYNALKVRNIDTALLEVPGAPHNIAGRPSQLITKISHILAWFEKYRSASKDSDAE